MSQGIVDDPEVVQVQGYYRRVILFMIAPVQRSFELPHEQGSIGQAGLRIVERQSGQPLVELPMPGDVVHDALPEQGFTSNVAHQPGLITYPHLPLFLTVRAWSVQNIILGDVAPYQGSLRSERHQHNPGKVYPATYFGPICPHNRSPRGTGSTG